MGPKKTIPGGLFFDIFRCLSGWPPGSGVWFILNDFVMICFACLVHLYTCFCCVLCVILLYMVIVVASCRHSSPRRATPWYNTRVHLVVRGNKPRMKWSANRAMNSQTPVVYYAIPHQSFTILYFEILYHIILYYIILY